MIEAERKTKAIMTNIHDVQFKTERRLNREVGVGYPDVSLCACRANKGLRYLVLQFAVGMCHAGFIFVTSSEDSCLVIGRAYRCQMAPKILYCLTLQRELKVICRSPCTVAPPIMARIVLRST